VIVADRASVVVRVVGILLRRILAHDGAGCLTRKSHGNLVVARRASRNAPSGGDFVEPRRLLQKRRGSLRLVLPTTGSRGDVQPYVALGVGLQAAGFDVRVVTHEDFEGFVRGHGLDFHPLPIVSRAWHATEDGQRLLSSGNNPLAFIRHFVRLRVPVMRDILASCYEAARDADVVIGSTTAMLFAYSLAEKLRLPTLAAHYGPMVPSSRLASCLMPACPRWLPGQRVYNRLSHLLTGECFWQHMRTAFNLARADVLDLPPYPFLGPSPRLFQTTPLVCGCSPLVVPPPADWGEHQHMTGYWFLNSTSHWKPPSDLLDFLHAGPAPACVGFGSMASGNVEEFTDIILGALEQSGQRAILLTGWGGLRERRTSERVFVAETVPHDWLFPKTAAVVHHGGAGTTAAAIRAGVPSVVVPFMADQSFWGGRIYQLGVGPAPIPRRRLTTQRLAAAITQATQDSSMRAAAQWLGARVRMEDGTAAAVRVIEEFCHARLPHSGRSLARKATGKANRHGDPVLGKCRG